MDGARNTLAAFERAIAAGADMIEFDVRRAKDGLVVFHDARCKGRRIGKLSRQELCRRTGVDVPWLTDVLELARHRIGVDVELKEDGYVAEVVELIRKYCDPEQTIISSFIDNVVTQSKRLAPEFRTSLMLGNPNPLTLPAARWSELNPQNRLRRTGCDFNGPFSGYAQLGAVGRAEKAGRQSIVWTINSRRGLERWLADSRVFGVITDRADVAKTIIGK